jgi:hypothetical protein
MVIASTSVDEVLLYCRSRNSDSDHAKLLAINFLELTSGIDFSEKINHDDIHVSSIFSADRPVNRSVLAACLWRMLPEPHLNWLGEPPWRAKVVQTLESLDLTLIRDLRWDTGAQSHEKLEKLATAAADQERKFNALLQTLTSLDRVKDFRKRFMEFIRKDSAKILIFDFISTYVLNNLSDLFESVEDYIDARSGTSVIPAYDIAIYQGIQLEKTTSDKNYIYDSLIKNNLSNKIINLIQEDFSSNDAIRPTALTLRLLFKKYPLHEVNASIELGLILKNEGPGYGHGIELEIVSDVLVSTGLSTRYVGRLAAQEAMLIDVPMRTEVSVASANLLADVTWQNSDQSQGSLSEQLTIDAQRPDIDWTRLSLTDPYSLEPTVDEHELVGRRDVLTRLISRTRSSNVGSTILQGQKRVGKTSIARALQSRLCQEGDIVLYREAGDYMDRDPERSVATLGSMICSDLIASDSRLSHLNRPSFSPGSLQPLTEFLDAAIKLIPEKRIIIVIDEFDASPLGLYLRSPSGEPFFYSLRASSSRPPIGYILVGGENMNKILEYRGVVLNKWNTISVDYFSREDGWKDYIDLVQRPVAGIIEYDQDAIATLHEETAGNPFFTKLICQCLLQYAISAHDCYITRREVLKAVDQVAQDDHRNKFQHFWDDAILEEDIKRSEAISIQRRRILIAVSEGLKASGYCGHRELLAHPLLKGLDNVERDVEELLNRRVLVQHTKSEQRVYDFKVALFRRWMHARGVGDIITTFPDLDDELERRKEEQRIRIRPDELIQLVKKWPHFKGRVVTDVQVRAWIEQESDARDQRALFELLNGVIFYPDSFIRDKLADLDKAVRNGLAPWVRDRKVKRSDILVSYLDGLDKSGAHLARLYAEVGSIYTDNVVEPSRISDTLGKRDNIQALVFVDDFVGTGKSAKEYLTKIDKSIAQIANEKGIKIVFGAVVAFHSGWSLLEQHVDTLSIGPRIVLHRSIMLEETEKCFSSQATNFSSAEYRQRARRIASHWGNILEKKCPLGFGALELGLVFEHTCPNNSLPILWSESTSPRWVPLFKRN